MLKTIRKTEDLRAHIAGLRKRGKSIGLVPTMGYLHEGHLALVRECRRRCDVVVVSIFVNPKQFGPDEDLDRYPRDLRHDRRLLAALGCDIVFVPPIKRMYPEGFLTLIGVETLRDLLCGRTRRGHFDGVTLVVLKLLLAVMPDVAFFGEKDYQQLVIVERMVRDLGLPVTIEGVPTVRDKDGVALSSRNRYLSVEQRAVATSLYKSLELGKLLIASGERRSGVIEDRMVALMVDSGVTKVEYAAVVDPATLEHVKYIDSDVRLAVAAWVGETRLIDNIAVGTSHAERRRRLRGNTACVILAAGEGQRMKSDRPKLLHTIGGRSMIEHVIGAARGAGMKEIFAVVGHKSNRLEPLVKQLGVRTITQAVQRGTGHAVLQAFPHLADFNGNVVVLSGDTPLIRASTIRHILSLHARHSNAVTFASAIVPDAKGYGRIVRDGDGSYLKIVEEKDADSKIRRLKEINAGLYCFKARPLFDALFMLTADNVQMEYYLPDSIGSIKARGGRVEAVVVDDHTEVLGVNTAAELKVVRGLYSRRRTDEDHKRGLEDGIHRKG
jgi:pantoate--beta-alanine ligase